MIRVLVVEDSSTERQLLVEIIAAESQTFAVVGQAKNGLEAVEMTRRLRPDVVTMDIRMPLLDGLEATLQIMRESPTPVVVISGRGVLEVRTSLEALQAGALAVLEKPAGPAVPGFAERCRALLQTVRLMAEVKVVRRSGERPSAAVALPSAVAGPRERPRAIGIATSTGGPAALQEIFSRLPGDFPAPILVVQHITNGFVGGLAAWLQSTAKVRVKVAEQDELAAAGVVYLASDDRHLGLSSHGHLVVSAAAPVGGFRPSGTFLFASMAQALGPGLLAVILTGMGRDGVDGLRKVKASGGCVLAQDEASSVIFGMPAAAIEAGLADEIRPLADLAGRLISLATIGGQTK
ncbi:MAG TPA: chemotaxis-specific protein-glutamate methyltransferase CheB [Myxococcales bacterium]|jgi:two-component system chemotaxis response regulator CheB|nr:chemotaxis-specific protein-glutamate methyltransferase CheB [Myxococcales bacterium]